MRRLVLPLLLLVAACHSGETTNQSATTEQPEKGDDSKEVDDYVAEQRSAGAMTSVDAASGDSAGMPGDFSGPTAGEIAERQREKARAAHDAMEHALDEAEQVDVNLPDPVTGAEPAGGETSVVETN